MKFLILALAILLFVGGFYGFYRWKKKRSAVPLTAEELARAPRWAQEAVWYQIFVERFRNGDPANDPTKEDIVGAYPDDIPPDWKTTPWTRQWYRPDDWFEQVGLVNYWDRMQLRRYGGDLQGVMDKLDYLEELGVNAIYFNPLNDAPSLHKYDPRYWHHIDRNFGPDPKGDAEILASENPADPKTWQWTSADRLFLDLVRACRRRGIRVILDYSWNHTGMKFWALEDVRRNGPASPYADWYDIEHFNDPNNPEDELKYKAWLGIKYLPELKKDTLGDDKAMPFEGDLHSPAARQHIFDVARRWLDPDGDGDPSDGIDGFRLDVAAEVPLDFWRAFRREVRAINPEAYLVGEVWWQEWPDHLMEPHVFLQGDMFDAIMNYRWFRPARHFFAAAPDPLPPSAFVRELERLAEGIRPEYQHAMMNLTASHDAPRTSTSLFNRGKYKYHTKPFEDNNYRIDRPDDDTWDILKMLLIHQYTYVGSPHIWYGDEVGMWASDDPDCRKPMVWADLAYEDETIHPIAGRERKADPVKPDLELREFYRQLIALRKNTPALKYGSLEFLLADDENNTLAYRRAYEGEQILAIFNRSGMEKQIELPAENTNRFVDVMNNENTYPAADGRFRLTLPAMTGGILRAD
jgi:glycosidase